MKRYIGAHKVRFFKALATMLVAFLFQVSSYFVQMQLINTVLEGNVRKLAIQMAAMLILWLLMILFDFLGENSMAKLVQTMNCELRANLSRGIQKMSVSEFHRKDIGEYLSWYTNDLDQIEQLGFYPFFQLVSYVMQAVVAVIGLFVLHWAIAALVILLSVAMALVPKIFKRKMSEMGSHLSASQDAFLNQIKDVLSGFDITKAFDKMLRFMLHMGKASGDYEKSRYHFTFQKNKSSLAVQAVNFAGQLLTSFVVFLFAILKVTPIGTIYGSGNLINMLFSATQQILTLRVSLAASKPFFEKLKQFSSYAQEEEPEKLPELPAVQSEITVKDLTYAYGEKQIFSQAEFEFEIGKKYAVTGPSGSGKTTLLRLLLGQLTDYGGSVLYDGNDIKNFDPDSIFRRVGYVSQNVFLFNTTIRDNIVLGDSFEKEEITGALEESALTEDIQAMPEGLDTPVGENGSRLSGGQRQRIAIARALLHRKSILLMDEGTSALDRKSAELIQDRLLSNPDITLILVSHHLEETGTDRFDRVYRIAGDFMTPPVEYQT